MSEKSELPPLSDASVAGMEQAIFDRIAHEPRASAVADGRRRHRWATALGVAAAFAAGVLIGPPLLNGLGSATPSILSDSAAVAPERDAAGEVSRGVEEGSGDGGGDRRDSSSGAVAPRDETGDRGADTPSATLDDTREIVVTAEMALRVRDAKAAADEIGALAAEHGGFVESASLGLDPNAGSTATGARREPGTGWISIRVPATDLNEVITVVGEEGEVLRTSISRDDVTSTAVDLRARIASARTSVERLTELMSESGSVADLVAAESALSERQAQLESYEQQLKAIDEQVALSTLSVQLTEQTTATEADPAGFGDGLLAGWNGLILSMNGLVVAIGFLLPWLGIAAIVILVVWLVRRHMTRHPRTSRR